MSYIGGGPYYAEPCPICGNTLWNGRCENPDCYHHWHPKDDDEDTQDEDRQRFFTVGELKSILAHFPDNTIAAVCGDNNCYCCVGKNNSYVSLNCDHLQEFCGDGTSD